MSRTCLEVQRTNLYLLQFNIMGAQLLKAVQAIAQSVQSHFWPNTLGDWSQLLLVLLTAATLGTLIKYTFETAKLRWATQEQVLVTQRLLEQAQSQVREAQSQNEYSLMPIVELTTSRSEGFPGTHFAVRNTGNGPAFNITIRPFDEGGGSTYSFQQGTSIAAGEREFALLFIDSTHIHLSDFTTFLQRTGDDSAALTSIVYQSATGHSYETSHTIRLAPGGKTLIIDFDKFTKLDRLPSWVKSKKL